jgi:hypothetical protein
MITKNFKVIKLYLEELESGRPDKSGSEEKEVTIRYCSHL